MEGAHPRSSNYSLNSDHRLGSGVVLWAEQGEPGTLPAQPIAAATLLVAARSIVLARDFSLHHPQWDRYDPKAEGLLQLARLWDLSLGTPEER